jgi:hypothetical protein
LPLAVKILFDQGTPTPLRSALAGHVVSTAFEMGWAQLSNGALLREANAQFDVLITTDRNIRYQQHIAGLRLAILVLPTTSWPKIRVHTQQVVSALAALHSGDVVELEFA